jgi:hypothetical protein
MTYNGYFKPDGHMRIMLAKAMGANVAAITIPEEKRESAIALEAIFCCAPFRMCLIKPLCEIIKTRS